ncbi:MAG TPA: universal stress protein [Candidatus Polarisedimenticolaceae bacterium]|nr:universal stress protein [Candidatus Polarisedimenticolaceae bacterium]
MYDIRTILLTTDFSDTSRRALDPARAVARRFGARIVLVYVEEDRLPPLVVEYMAVGVEDVLNQQVEQSRKRLEEFAADHLAGIDGLELVVGVGTPHVEIVRLAQEHAADLIVMATHGRGVISHALMGSTTERVLRRAPCPVLVACSDRAD